MAKKNSHRVRRKRLDLAGIPAFVTAKGDTTAGAVLVKVARMDGTAELFIAPEKVDGALKQHLGNHVALRPRMDFEGALADFAGKTVAVDPNHAVAGIFHALEQGGAKVVQGTPVIRAELHGLFKDRDALVNVFALNKVDPKVAIGLAINLLRPMGSPDSSQYP